MPNTMTKPEPFEAKVARAALVLHEWIDGPHDYPPSEEDRDKAAKMLRAAGVSEDGR